MRALLSLAVVLASLQAVLGFMPAAPVRSVRARDVRMSASFEGPDLNKAKSVLAGLTPAVLAAPVLATEGTGEVSLNSQLGHLHPDRD
jgi:hypothetical protein